LADFLKKEAATQDYAAALIETATIMLFNFAGIESNHFVKPGRKRE